MIRLNPYINFKNNTKEAMEFYKSVFGAKLDMNTFKEFQASQDLSEDNKIMHSMIEAENGVTFMASDTPNGMSFEAGSQISMSLSGDEEETLREYWQKLSEGGQVIMPMEKAPWGDIFGMLTDKFGVKWMIDVVAKK